MRLFWVLLALLLTLLTVGGLISATKTSDPVGAVGDLVISCLVGWGALGSWRRAR
ncbi:MULTISPECIES: hypothetical protein [unclassified Streptomyces]|uniref:hypothetical protein n=1 Tax=unclassified Streptomyces TaxID=2593676 RepID=UPI003819AF71